jgi:acetolactate synthase-1/2/3 large subunit
VVAVAGDGGFMMNSQEIETAVRLGLDLTVIVLRDNAYGMIKWKQANMDFAELRHGHGQPGFRAVRRKLRCPRPPPASVAAEFGPAAALRRPGHKPGVHLIDLPIDYSDNDRILNREIKALSAEL